MSQERRVNVLTEQDIETIAEAVTEKTKTAFHLDDEAHYNSHKRLDKVLDAYDSATNAFWKTFLAFVIVGAVVLAGLTAAKGISVSVK